MIKITVHLGKPFFCSTEKRRRGSFATTGWRIFFPRRKSWGQCGSEFLIELLLTLGRLVEINALPPGSV